MSCFRKWVTLLVLAASPLAAAAAENSWSPLPAAASQRFPGQLLLTRDPAISYALDPVGPLRSDDGGRHWTKIETPVLTWSMVVDPAAADNLFLTGWDYVFRSTDGGRSWAVALQIPERFVVPEVLVSRHFPGRVYAASQRELWQSTDGGATFVLLGALPEAAEPGLPVSLAEAADGGLYLLRSPLCGIHGCGSEWQLDRSADQGKSWSNLRRAAPGAPRIESVVAHPSRPESVYFVWLGNAPYRLERSDDRGATVTDLGAFPGHGAILLTDPSLPDALYLTNHRELFRSLDRGASWQNVVLPVSPAAFDSARFALASPGRLVFYGRYYASAPPPGAADDYLSTDGGASWSLLPVEGPFFTRVSELATSGPSGRIYFTDHASIYRSNDGASWEGFASPRLIGNLAGDPLDADTVYGSGILGFDHGILRSRDGGQSFEMVLETKYVFPIAAIVRDGATTLVAPLEDGQVARSVDGGTTWIVAPPQVVPAGGEFYRLETLAYDGITLYGATLGGRLFGSLDGGATWTLRDFGTPAPAAGGGLLARLDLAANTVESTTTGTPPWQTFKLPFPAREYSTKLHVDPAGGMYLLDEQVLLRSRDRGRSWQALSQDLPRSDGRPAKLAFDAADPDRLYLGTDEGLYAGTFEKNPPLALLRGRFEARLRWRTRPEAPWTAGEPASLADQNGIFRLFSPERAEVAVQILDGRAQGGRFWVFVASMTDVELELEVTDRVEGELWRHHQPAGRPLSFADLAAFPRLPQPTGGALPQPFGGQVGASAQVLLAGRFEVSVSRPAAGGEAVAASGRKLFGDTAGFTFFDPGAIDLVVNVIDGRPINGKFWVFGGSLTDQEFEIEIIDHETGAIYRHRNPAGAFAGFGDTEAF